MQEIDETAELKLRVSRLEINSLRKPHTLGVTGISESSAGRLIRDMSKRCNLVHETAASNTLAESWVKAAANGGTDWDAAAAFDSDLSESTTDGTQGIFSKMIAYFPDDSSTTFRLHDVHSTPSVCGPDFKPDIIASSGPHLLPTNTGLILELKTQKQSGGHYASSANIHQVIYNLSTVMLAY